MKYVGIKIVLLLLTIVCFVSACGMESKIVEDETLVTQAVEWQQERISLMKAYEVVSVTNERIYGGYLSDDKWVVECVDKNTGNVQGEIPLPELSYICDLAVDDESNIYIVGEKAAEQKMILLEISAAGELMGEKVLEIEDIDTAKFVTLNGIEMDGDGKKYLRVGMAIPLKEAFGEVSKGEEKYYIELERLYVKDKNWNTLFYKQIPEVRGSELIYFGLNNEKIPEVLMKDREGNIYCQRLDIEKGVFSEAVYLKNEELSGVNNLDKICFVKDGFVFYEGTALNKYTFETGKKSKILDFIAYGILPDDILYLGMSDKGIEIIENYGKSRISEYTMLSEGQAQKTILTLAVMQETKDIEKIIADFNRYNENVQVQMISYFDEEMGYEESLLDLKFDIVSNKAPDIIDVSDIDYDKYIDKGIFVDLIEYMENDIDFKPDMLMQPVINAHKSGDKLYSISPSFQIYTIWGNNNIIHNRSGLSLGELKKMLKQVGTDINAIYGFSADEPVLTTLCTLGMDEFIDWDKNSCSFNSEYFKDILSFAKEYKGEQDIKSPSGAICDERILMTVGVISSVADYQIQAELYDDNLAFVGYPVEKGTGTAVGFRGSELAINNASQNKELAWDFVKYYLVNGYGKQGFPTVKSQFYNAMEEATKESFIEYPEGTYKEMKGSYYDEDISFEVYAAKQDDVDAVIRLVNMADRSFRYDIEILAIIREEAESYLIGQKNVDEVAEIIQNRVELYMKERVK